MTGILLVCVPLLLGTADIGHKVTDRAPFSVDRVLEEVSRNAVYSSRRGPMLGDWRHAVGSSLLEEFMIDTTITYSASIFEQRSASVAFDGTNYLVVWSDRSPVRGIYGCRVDTLGTILDLPGIAICTVAGDQEAPSVAFDGTNYLVVWEDERDWPGSDIYCARVSTTGAVLDTSGIPVSTAAGNQEVPSVAFGGTNYLVVWEDERPGVLDNDIYCARVDTAGAVLDTSGIALCTAEDYQRKPSTAFSGSSYLVVWNDYRNGAYADIYGVRVDMSGTVLDSSEITICTDSSYQGPPSVGFDGVNCLVVWHDGRSGVDSDIYGARVDTSGAVLDPSGLAINTVPDGQYCPCVACDGVNCLVVWHDVRSGIYSDIYGARVDTSGAVLDPSGIVISAGEEKEYARVASGGVTCLVVWEEDPWGGQQSNICGARVHASGLVLDTLEILMTVAANDQWFPSAASDGSGYFVVWSDHRNDEKSGICGVRVSETGMVLDSSGIAISSATDGGQGSHSAVVRNGNNYLVMWEDWRGGLYHHIYGTRVDPSGTVLDSSAIAICTTACSDGPVSMAACSSGCLVVWSDFRSGTSPPQIYGARVDTAGIVLDPSGIPICATLEYQKYPSVAFDGTNYLVVWENRRNLDTTQIRGARVDTSGTVLDPSGIDISVADDYYDNTPSVAFDGSNYLVVWCSWSGTDSDILGARVDTSGAVLDSSALGICTAAETQRHPSIAFDGTNYLVAWDDYRLGLDEDIYGTRVTRSGVVLDPSGLELINQPSYRWGPIVTRGPGNRVLLVHNGFARSPYFSIRAFGALYTGVGIDEEEVAELDVGRLRFELFQNKPNPFNRRTVIGYSLPASAPVTLEVYDSSGRMMRMLIDEEKSAGRHSVSWNGRETSGRKLPSGIYFYRLRAGESTITRKMILLR